MSLEQAEQLMTAAALVGTATKPILAFEGDRVIEVKADGSSARGSTSGSRSCRFKRPKPHPSTSTL